MNLPKLLVPAFSTAQFWLDKNFYQNFYKLKGVTDPKDAPIVLDLGAFCGYFTFSALALGAKKVYAFEPFLDNYRVLLENTKDAGDKIISYQLGVYTEYNVLNLNYPKIKEGSYYDFADLDEGIDEPYLKCVVLSLDQVLALIPEPIDILKINLGYAEIDILLKSNDLFNKVANICLETKENDLKVESFVTEMKNRGYKESFTQKNQEDNSTLVIIGKEPKKYFNI